ncbi:MAG: hypothetical protein SOZ66_07495 [Candidatus Cryptobacteroides sp.]|nr:hypothetical protein [Candidatus Cryptobacteroides sp.]
MYLVAIILALIPWENAVLILSGASAMEDLGEETLERFEALRDNPIALNRAGRSILLGSGLFSAYQVASILEYRRTSGSILSISELALIDGIGEKMASALAHFVRLDLPLPGSGTAPTPESFHGNAALRSGIRGSPSPDSWMGAAKLSLDLRGRASLGAGISRTLDGVQKQSVSAAIYGKGVLGKIVAGDFNARFGQGLALWSGFSMTGVSSTSSLNRNPSGVSPVSSFSGEGRLRGVAADFYLGRWSSTLLAAKDSYALNLGRTSLEGQWSATALYGGGSFCLSADCKYSFSGFDIWGETAMELPHRAPACLLGAGWSPSYGKRIALVGRFYSPFYSGSRAGALRSSTRVSDELGISSGLSLSWVEASFDWCKHPRKGGTQARSIFLLKKEFPLGGALLTPSLRLSLRDRPSEQIRFRSDLRSDLDLRLGAWQMHGRYEILLYRDKAWMWYAEGLYRHEAKQTKALAALRFSIFKVDNWDDRIYVYERDLPGMFTSRACYGRGLSGSFVGGVTLRSARRSAPVHSFNARLSLTAYPWNLDPKPSRLEARVQYGLKW